LARSACDFNALEAYRANLRMFDALMQMVRRARISAAAP
jgi:hypothetical protein